MTILYHENTKVNCTWNWVKVTLIQPLFICLFVVVLNKTSFLVMFATLISLLWLQLSVFAVVTLLCFGGFDAFDLSSDGLKCHKCIFNQGPKIKSCMAAYLVLSLYNMKWLRKVNVWDLNVSCIYILCLDRMNWVDPNSMCWDKLFILERNIVLSCYTNKKIISKQCTIHLYIVHILRQDLCLMKRF